MKFFLSGPSGELNGQARQLSLRLGHRTLQVPAIEAPGWEGPKRSTLTLDSLYIYRLVFSHVISYIYILLYRIGSGRNLRMHAVLLAEELHLHAHGQQAVEHRDVEAFLLGLLGEHRGWELTLVTHLG